MVILLPPLSQGQSSITLEGQSYTLVGHPRTYMDGPSGAFVTSNAYTGSRPAKANSGNPSWVALQSVITGYASVPYTSPGNILYYYDGSAAAAYAITCYTSNTHCADALYLLNNFPSFYPLYCDETHAVNCTYGSAPTSFGPVYYYPGWILAYELMRGQMTTTQRQMFADMFLNDKASAGGVDGAPSTSCTNPSVVNGATITSATAGSGAQTIINTSTNMFGAGNPIQVGYWLNADNGYGNAQIVSINSPTQAVIGETTAYMSWVGVTGNLNYRRNTWIAGDCGANWVSKHENFNPQSLSFEGASSAYPSGAGFGGGNAAVWSSNNTYAQAAGMMASLISLVDDDVNASVRSQPQITALYNEWYTGFYLAVAKTTWTGFHETGGSAYGMDRPPHGAAMYSILTESISGTPPAIAGKWEQNLFYPYTYNWLPSAQVNGMFWGQNVNGPGVFSNSATTFFAPLYYANRNTPIGEQYNWWLQNRLQAPSWTQSFGNTPGTNLWWSSSGFPGTYAAGTAPFAYAFMDPTFPISALTSGAPTAFALNQVDATSGKTPQSVLISRTGYSSVADTLINFYGLYEEYLDHNQPCVSGPCYYPGDYRIFKGNYLLAPDGGAAQGGAYTSAGSHWWNNGNQLSGYMEIGGAYSVQGAGSPLAATMPRANTDGTDNRYAYALVDSTASYLSSVAASRVHRHLVDFKGGGQQFVVVYDDVATSAGQMKRTYLHYANNKTASGDVTKGDTVLSGSQITSTYPGTGNGDATQLLTQVLAPGSNQVYVYTDNPNGTYTGGNGDTFRVSLCASANGTSCDSTNTAAEFMVVHMPATGSGNSMPALTQPGCAATGGNCRAVQVGGSSPKVAVFARSGALLTGISFTTTHAGTAQYLLAGMSPGTYTFTGGSSPSCTVVANDNTCYFESTAGTLSAGSPVLSYSLAINTAGNGSGTISGTNCTTGSYASGTAYSCTATPKSGSAFAAWSSTCGGTANGNTYSGSLTSNCTMTATFNSSAVAYNLAVSSAGTGTGTISGADCASGSYASGTGVSCTATSASRSSFAGWSGACSGTGACSFTLLANSTVTATFNLVASPLALGLGTCSSTMTGTQYVAFSGCTLAASGGTPPYTYSWKVVTDGSYASLPEGLSLGSSTGTISGTVYGQGRYLPQFVVRDSAGATATLSTLFFSIAGDNSLGGCSLFPSDSIFHQRVDALPVDTSPAAPIYTPFQSSTLRVFFGNDGNGNLPNGIPFLRVPYNQPNVPVTTTMYQSYFSTGPFPPYAPPEATSNFNGDRHVLVVQTAGGGSPCRLWEMWQGIHQGNDTWDDSSNAFWSNIGSTGTGAYAMLPQDNGSADAAGLPVAPLLVTADEVIGTGTPSAPNGAVQHPIRFTVNPMLNRYVWPATAHAGTGSCSGGYSDGNGMLLQGAGAPASCTMTGPAGEIYRLKASVPSPPCAATSPQAAIIVQGLRNYGIILADNGISGGLIGTPDARWNDSDLSCLTSLTLSDFEPVNVSSVAAALTANYNGSGYSAPVTSYQTTSGTPAFSIALRTGSATNVTVQPGGVAKYDLVLTPVGSSTLIATVALTASGFPPGSTATFTPATVPSGTGTSDVSLSVQTSATSASVLSSRPRWTIAVCLLFMPLIGLRRRKLLGSRLSLGIRLLAGVLFLASISVAMSGCSGVVVNNTGPGSTPTAYTITVTAASGPVQKTTTVTVTVQ